MRRLMLLAAVLAVTALGLTSVMRADAANSCPGGTIANATINDSVVIDPGTSCQITNTTITGSLTVNKATNFDMVGGSVGTNVTFDGGTGATNEHLTICGTSIGGSLIIKNIPSDISVDVGDDDGEECTGPDDRSAIKGGLTMTNNAGDVSVESPSAATPTTFGGSASVSGNTGDFDLAHTKFVGSAIVSNNPGSGELTGNVFGNALSCSNNGSLDNNSEPNTARAKTGGCAAL